MMKPVDFLSTGFTQLKFLFTIYKCDVFRINIYNIIKVNKCYLL